MEQEIIFSEASDLIELPTTERLSNLCGLVPGVHQVKGECCNLANEKIILIDLLLNSTSRLEVCQRVFTFLQQSSCTICTQSILCALKVQKQYDTRLANEKTKMIGTTILLATTLSAVFVPLTFITSLFSMNVQIIFQNDLDPNYDAFSVITMVTVLIAIFGLSMTWYLYQKTK